MVVLTAGTGRVVQTIARELAALPQPKRFLPAGAARSPVPGFELVAGGVSDASARAKALDGAQELVVLPTFDARSAESQAALVREARQAGVRRIHLGSLIGADARSPTCLLRWVGLVEREVIASGLPHAILRCAPFMQNLSLFTRRDGLGLELVGPFRAVAFPWLDASDVGVLLATRLRGGDLDSVVCNFSGPEAIDFDGVAQRLEDALHEPVR